MHYSSSPSMPMDAISPVTALSFGLSSSDYVLSQIDTVLPLRVNVSQDHSYSAANTPEILHGVLVSAYT